MRQASHYWRKFNRKGGRLILSSMREGRLEPSSLNDFGRLGTYLSRYLPFPGDVKALKQFVTTSRVAWMALAGRASGLAIRNRCPSAEAS